MKHLSDEQLYDLARKVILEAPFTSGQVAGMRHISGCNSCYEALCCIMAMQDVSEHLEEFVADTAAAPAPRQGITAVIRLLIGSALPVLEQPEAQTAAWQFCTPLFGATRSSGRTAGTEKLADIANSQSFVAYNPEKGLLAIQLDSADCPNARAYLINSRGEQRQILFEQLDSLLWAEVSSLEAGEYRLVLEK